MTHTITVIEAMFAYLHGMPMDLRTGSRGMPGVREIYGWVDPHSTWPDDYYIGLSETFGEHKPTGCADIDYGSFYPPRLFIHGEDDDGNALPRLTMLRHLKDAGLYKSDVSFWKPCRPWRGYVGGRPTFHLSLRAHTDYGYTFCDWLHALSRNPLPQNCEWEFSHGMTGRLYVELNDEQLHDSP